MHSSFRSRLGYFLVLLLLLAIGLGMLASFRGEARAANTPRIWLSQKVGPPTASAQVSGKGFGLNETVFVDFDTTQIGMGTADATGAFLIRISVPRTALPGTHTLQATGQSSGLSASASFLVRTDWTQFHFGPQHTGYNPYENVLSTSNVSTLTLDWSFATGNEILSSTAVANGVVYVGSNDDKLYALDAVTGALKWSYTTGGSISSSSPAVTKGVVYVGSSDHALYALDAMTGTFKWSYTAGGGISTSPAVANGVVYVGSMDHTLYALDTVTGTLKWSLKTGSYIASSPAVANGVVYFGSYPGKLDALNARTGAHKWSFYTSKRSDEYSSPAVANGVVYFGSQDDGLYALDAVTGTLKWYIFTGDPIESSPAVVNGVVYVGSTDGKLYAFHLPGIS